MTSSINFFSEHTDFELSDDTPYIQWLLALAAAEKTEIQELTYIFCSDEYLHQINIDYLQHDTYTDIITFPYQEGSTLSGDIFISTDRIEENAKKFKVPFSHELLRVMAHGLLHLCGYQDKLPEDTKIMRQKEEEAIALFSNH